MVIPHGYNSDDFGVGYFSTLYQNVFAIVSVGTYLPLS